MKSKKIYVLCPKGVKTGGPELLHQLVYQINSIYGDKTALIAYYGNLKNHPVNAFQNYVGSNYINYTNIIDDYRNIVIFPETSLTLLYNRFHEVRKYIWWLSVDNYFLPNSITFNLCKVGLLKTLYRLVRCRVKNNFIRNKKQIMNADLHLCQSAYAENYLKNKIHIPLSKIKYLSDYVNNIYVKDFNSMTILQKKDVILFNPRKGYKFTRKIIKASKKKNWKWMALEGLDNKEMKHYLSSSKVYIDFGNHPGKDRLPREAAICGCCVITGKNGAASYYKDIPIPKKYKFFNKKKDIPKIIDIIEECLNNYDICIKDFAFYRKSILEEEKIFKKDVKKIFGKELDKI